LIFFSGDGIAPWIPHEPHGREKISQPKDLLTSLFMVADLKGMEPAEVVQKTTQNALELFGLDLTI
jgi:Tat protein secretion system quality control protein TatD with DNase activity